MTRPKRSSASTPSQDQGRKTRSVQLKMSDEEEVYPERRSMVGAPPTAGGRRSSVATPKASTRTPSARVSSRSAAKRRRDDYSDDESPKNEDDSEENESDEDIEEVTRPKKKKKKPSKATDSAVKKSHKKKVKEPVVDSEQEKVEKKEPTPVPTPEPVVKIPAISKYSPLQLMCDHLLRKIQAKDPEEFFAFPVTPSMAPDYHTIIAHPMDFSQMRQKIEDDAYEAIPQMKTDAELIVSNALTYNNPNTVYHLAATRLAQITRYYFSEQYLRFIFHSLPFANKVPLEKAGLAPNAPVHPRVENKRRLAVVDSMTPEDCLQSADPAVRGRLSTRKPAKISFVDNKDGATVLNVLGETEKKNIRLLDIVAPLEEGNPGLLSLGEQRMSVFSLANVNMINYLTYGPFSSFAPQYDSTWATLNKRDTDLLLRIYGDRSTASEVFSMRNMVADCSDGFIKAVDDLLCTLTDGEHERVLKVLEHKNENEESVDELMNEVESLGNLGFDVSYIGDVRQAIHTPRRVDLQTELNNTGRAVLDLARMQNQRLSSKPPITLTKAAPPSTLEAQLASNVQQQLVGHIGDHAQPGQMISAQCVQSAIGFNNPEVDEDIMSEFFM